VSLDDGGVAGEFRRQVLEGTVGIASPHLCSVEPVEPGGEAGPGLPEERTNLRGEEEEVEEEEGWLHSQN
jgi:hypothetical protein